MENDEPNTKRHRARHHDSDDEPAVDGGHDTSDYEHSGDDPFFQREDVRLPQAPDGDPLQQYMADLPETDQPETEKLDDHLEWHGNLYDAQHLIQPQGTSRKNEIDLNADVAVFAAVVGDAAGPPLALD